MASVLSNISNIIIPVLVFYIVAYGALNKTNVYEEFVKGAKDGLKTVVGIMPTLVALMTAVGVLRASGFLDFLGNLVRPLSERAGFPAELVPLAFIKMFHDWSDYIYYDELYGDDFLYYECLFPGGKGNENEVYADGRPSFNLCGNRGQRGACGADDAGVICRKKGASYC